MSSGTSNMLIGRYWRMVYDATESPISIRSPQMSLLALASLWLSASPPPPVCVFAVEERGYLRLFPALL